MSREAPTVAAVVGDALARTRELLLRAGYTGGGLARVLRTGAALNLPAGELPRARLLLDDTKKLDCLIALLLLGDELDPRTAETALGDDLNTLIDAGLVGRRAGRSDRWCR